MYELSQNDPGACPECGEAIGAAAIVCVHCGFDRRTKARIRSSVPPTLSLEQQARFIHRIHDDDLRKKSGRGLSKLFAYAGSAAACIGIALIPMPQASEILRWRLRFILNHWLEIWLIIAAIFAWFAARGLINLWRTGRTGLDKIEEDIMRK